MRYKYGVEGRGRISSMPSSPNYSVFVGFYALSTVALFASAICVANLLSEINDLTVDVNHGITAFNVMRPKKSGVLKYVSALRERRLGNDVFWNQWKNPATFPVSHCSFCWNWRQVQLQPTEQLSTGTSWTTGNRRTERRRRNSRTWRKEWKRWSLDCVC